MAERYGAETTVPDWAARLVCGQCGSPQGQHGGERDKVTIAQPLSRKREYAVDKAAKGGVFGGDDKKDLPGASTGFNLLAAARPT
jgi:hypothetical protein